MTYEQAAGRLTNLDELIGIGYAGTGAGRNNPAMDNVENTGPLPRGWYTLAEEFECRKLLGEGEVCVNCRGAGKHRHGPDVIRLAPDEENEMHGRAGFLIHGDNVLHDASQGCIVLDHNARARALQIGGRLEVV